MGEALVLWDVAEEHLEEAAFQWERWEHALVSPLLSARQVADGVEARLAAHVEGLTVAGTAAADRLLEPALREGEPGEAFAAASAMLELPEGVVQVEAALADADDERRQGLARALALSRRPEEGHLLALLESDHLTLAAAGLEALVRRGADPGPAVLRFLGSEEAALAVPALRAARSSAQPIRTGVERDLQHRDPAVRDAALETAIRLGFRSALVASRELVEAADPDAGFALALLAMSGDATDVPLLERALEVKSLRAAALIALGYAGRITCVEALLTAMEEDSKIARIAGETFSAITGIAIEGDLLAEEADESDELIPFEEDDLDADLVPGPEAELPLPDARAVAARWKSLSSSFDPAVRYLAGTPFTSDGLVRSFAAAPMRRRHLLAAELAVRSRGAYRVETRDWALEQLRSERRQQLAVRPETALPFSRLLRG